MIKKVKTEQLFSLVPEYLSELFSECEYPWQIIPKIKEYVLKISASLDDGYYEYKKGVIIHKSVKIYDLTTIEGNVFIGEGCEVRPGAFIRGNVITGMGCVIGNSTEIKNSVLCDFVQLPHYNYVGDSVLGTRTHLGASAICSNLKSDRKNVTVHADTEYDTSLCKLGAILADGVDVGCGSVLNPGTVVGKNSSVYPNITLRGVYPENSIVKGEKQFERRI